MKNKKSKKSLEIFLLIGIMLVLINCYFISAVGISKDYYTGNPAKVDSGETKVVVFGRLMASQETEDRKMKAEITEGMDIATLVSDEFNVPAGSINQEIKIKVSIPLGIPEGTEYKVSIKLSDVTPVPGGTGMVGFSRSQISSIPVVVAKTEVPATPSNNLIWWILLIIVIILIIILYLLYKKKKSNSSIKKSRK